MPLNDSVEANVTTKSVLVLGWDLTHGRLLIPGLGARHGISAAVRMLEALWDVARR